MPAAVIGGIIAAGGALGSAAIQSHAAGKAADQQVAAGDKALALQRDIYNQQQANEAPWRNQGAAAITTLGGLLGLPQGPAGGGPSGQISGSVGGGQAFGPLPNDTQQGALTDPSKQPDASYDTGGNWIGNVPQSTRATMASASGYGGSAQQHGSGPGAMTMVRLQAPTGEIEIVPADQVSHYTQQGAKVLGSV